MLVGWLVGALVGWLIFQTLGMPLIIERSCLVGGLVGGLIFGLVVGLRAGLSFSEIDKRAVPNEGIRRSAWNALVVGLFSWLVGLVVGLVVGLMLGPVLGLIVGLMLGPLLGLVVGLRAGATACLKHVGVRLWLIRNGSTPWNYVRFLDHAAERVLLRKVGGGYAFLHRMLLDYFAARYAEPSIGDARPAKPSSIKDELQTA